MLDADEIRALLNLEAHPLEGGHFAETWRGATELPAGLIAGAAPGDRAGRNPGAPAGGSRPIGTAIYYLLSPGTCSAMHRLRWDEIFHFYLGDPVEMLLLGPGDEGRVVTLGTDLRAGARPQVVVPAGVWQGARLAADGRVALLGTTMAPGFDPADFEIGDPAGLAERWPGFHAEIAARARR